MLGCVLSQLKPSELNILIFKKGLGPRPRPFSKLRMFLGLYPIHTTSLSGNLNESDVERRQILHMSTTQHNVKI